MKHKYLLLSVVALIVTCSLLTRTTLAFLGENVVNTGNTITAAELDFDVAYESSDGVFTEVYNPTSGVYSGDAITINGDALSIRITNTSAVNLKVKVSIISGDTTAVEENETIITVASGDTPYTNISLDLTGEEGADFNVKIEYTYEKGVFGDGDSVIEIPFTYAGIGGT